MGKILVVDDDADTREMIRRRLTEAGHHVLLLANGQAAYEATVAHKPDAVVLDVVMPVMGGMAVLRKLKSDSDVAGIPVIMLTAQDNPLLMSRSLSIGASAFLNQQMQPGELEVALLGLIGETATPEPTEDSTAPGADHPESVLPDGGLQAHDFEDTAREFIGEYYGFTWQEENRNISGLEIQIKKVNPDDIRLVYQLEGSADIIVRENADPVNKKFSLTVVVGRDGAVLTRRGDFFEELSNPKSKS